MEKLVLKKLISFMDSYTNPKKLQDLCDLKGCKFSFLNIKSLKANFNLLKADLESVNDVRDFGLIAIGISETWLNDNLHDSLYKISNYSLFRLDRKTGKRGGDIAVFVKD